MSAVLALVAVSLFYWAISRARKGDRPTKRRVGDAIGFAGFGICVATLAASVALGSDSILVPVIVFGSGVVLGAVGGTMAGWQQN